MLRTSAASRRKASQFHASTNNTLPASQRRAGLRTLNDPVTTRPLPTSTLTLTSTPTQAQAQVQVEGQTSTPTALQATANGHATQPAARGSSSATMTPPPAEPAHLRQRGKQSEGPIVLSTSLPPSAAAETGPASAPRSQNASTLAAHRKSTGARSTRDEGAVDSSAEKAASAAAAIATNTASASYASSSASSSRQYPSHITSPASFLDDTDSELSELTSSDEDQLQDNDDDEEAEVKRALKRRSGQDKLSLLVISKTQGKGKGRTRSSSSGYEVDSVLTTPGRRSTRISLSGSSMQQASARRDELDERLSGKTPSPVLAMLQQQQQQQQQQQRQHVETPTIPVKRGRGRPRKHPLPEGREVPKPKPRPKALAKAHEAEIPAAPETVLAVRGRGDRARLPVAGTVEPRTPEPSRVTIVSPAPATSTAPQQPPIVPSLAATTSSPATDGTPASRTESPVKRKRGRPPGSGKKQLAAKAAAAAAAAAAASAGVGETADQVAVAQMEPQPQQQSTPTPTPRPNISTLDVSSSSDGLRPKGRAERLASVSTPSRLASETPSTSQVTKRPKFATSKRWDDHVSGLYYNSVSRANSVSSTTEGEITGDGGDSRAPAFPEPMHFGKQLLTEERNFRLPPSWLEDAARIRAKLDAKRKPPHYAPIKANKYFSRPKLQGELPQCQCKKESNCGDGCMNRILQYVCSPKNCPCGERCTNISLGKRPNVRTEVFYCGPRGFGLRSLEGVPKGGFIDEYRGEVIDQAETNRRTEEYKKTGNYYFLSYDHDAGEFLDGGRKGNITRFANHSCDPNCYIEKWLLCGTDESRTADFQIGLFALKHIKAGDELTYDYGWSYFRPRTVSGDYIGEPVLEPCYCGAHNCAGVLGGKKLVPSKSAAAAEPGAKKAVAGVKVKRKPGRPKGIATKLAQQVLSHANSRIGKSGRGNRKEQEKAIVAKRAHKVIEKRAALEKKNKIAAQQNLPAPGSTKENSLTISDTSSSVEDGDVHVERPDVAAERAEDRYPTTDEAEKRWNEEFRIRSAELLAAQEEQQEAQAIFDRYKRAMTKAETEVSELRRLGEKGAAASEGEGRGRSGRAGSSRSNLNPRHLQFALNEAEKRLPQIQFDCAKAEQKALLAVEKQQRASARLDLAVLNRDVNMPPNWNPFGDKTEANGAATMESVPPPGASGSRGRVSALASASQGTAPLSESALRLYTSTSGNGAPSATSKCSAKVKAVQAPGAAGASTSNPVTFGVSHGQAGPEASAASPAAASTKRAANGPSAPGYAGQSNELLQTPGADSTFSTAASDSQTSEPATDSKRSRADSVASSTTTKRAWADLAPEEIEAREALRRERNAFLARKRRAKKRGIIIEDPTQHPLRKQSIQCEAAPDDTYIPDLPSNLIQLGMTKADARRVRNAFLARVRRARKRGNDETAAIHLSAKPMPTDEALADSPVIKAHRAKRSLAGGEGGGDMSSALSAAGDASIEQGTPVGAALGESTLRRLPMTSPLAYRSLNHAQAQPLAPPPAPALSPGPAPDAAQTQPQPQTETRTQPQGQDLGLDQIDSRLLDQA